MKKGIHTPQTTTEFYNLLTKTFDGQLTFTDVSYKNDLRDTISLDHSGYEIKLPNAFFEVGDHEYHFYHFAILDVATDTYLDVNGSYEYQFYDVMDFLHNYVQNVQFNSIEYLLASLKKHTDLDITYSNENKAIYVSQLKTFIKPPIHSGDKYSINPDNDGQLSLSTMKDVIDYVNFKWNIRCDLLQECELISDRLIEKGLMQLSNKFMMNAFITDDELNTSDVKKAKGQLTDMLYDMIIKNV
jgi:hypothetical protein